MIDKVKAGRIAGIRSVKSGLREYTHIKKNIYCASIKELVSEIKEDMTACHCRQKDGKGCGANSDCHNRAAQIECDASCCPILRFKLTCENSRLRNHEVIETEVRDCGEKGLGLFTLEDIAPQELVEEYVGEVITSEECSKRLDEIYKGEKHKYLMMLNKDLIVDATRKGNYARFINHSCDPNCEVQMWYVDGKPRLGIYSRRKISKTSELTLNYKFKRFGNETVVCYCGSAQCTNLLGKSEKRGERKKRRLNVGCGYDPVTAARVGIAMSEETISSYEASVPVIVCNGKLPLKTANSLRESKVLLVRNVLKTAEAFRQSKHLQDIFETT